MSNDPAKQPNVPGGSRPIVAYETPPSGRSNVNAGMFMIGLLSGGMIVIFAGFVAAALVGNSSRGNDWPPPRLIGGACFFLIAAAAVAALILLSPWSARRYLLSGALIAIGVVGLLEGLCFLAV